MNTYRRWRQTAGLFFTSMVCVVYSLSAQTTVTLQPEGVAGKDARLNSALGGNRGDYPELPIGAWTWNGIEGFDRSVLAFDFHEIPEGIGIYSATLYLYSATGLPSKEHSTLGGSNAWLIRRITAAWDESTITFANAPATSTIHEVLAGPSTYSTQNFVIDVRQLVVDMLADRGHSFGFMMQLPDEVFDQSISGKGYRKVVFASSDHPDPLVHPKLVINYIDPDAVDAVPASAEAIAVFPDPAKDIVSCTFNRGGAAALSVYNTAGRCVLHRDAFKSGSTIDLSTLPRGVYRVAVRSGRELRTTNLVKF